MELRYLWCRVHMLLLLDWRHPWRYTVTLSISQLGTLGTPSSWSASHKNRVQIHLDVHISNLDSIKQQINRERKIEAYRSNVTFKSTNVNAYCFNSIIKASVYKYSFSKLG